ncbi:MAG: cytochrome c-type biogenesis protein [Chakrabartia sp.]
MRWPLLLLILVSGSAMADSKLAKAAYADVQLADEAQEKSAKALMESIRCLVCQGQSIADSDAEMAADMRSLIRTRIAEGEKPDVIRAWLVERYGNWVTYEPPMSALTAPIWIAPLVLFGLGLILVSGRLRRRRR